MTAAAAHRTTHGRGRPDRRHVTLTQDLPLLDEVEEGAGELSATERANLAAAESVVETFQASGWAAGQALAVIAKGGYYRDTHPGDFPRYLWERWGLKTSPAYRLMEGWRLAALIAPKTAGRGVTGSHVSTLLPVVKADQKHGEGDALALFAGAQATVGQVGGARLKVTAEMLDAAVEQLQQAENLPQEPAERAQAVEALAGEAVMALLQDGKKAEEKKAGGPLRLTVPQALSAELDEWTTELSAGLRMPLSRDAVVARIVELALEDQDALLAVAQRIEAESAEKVAGARRWTWTPAGQPRGYIRIAEERPKGHKAAKGEPEIRCTAAGEEPCGETPVWRVTHHPVGKSAKSSTVYWCEEHLPADHSPPGRWNG
jgi:hypothetical protein